MARTKQTSRKSTAHKGPRMFFNKGGKGATKSYKGRRFTIKGTAPLSKV